MGVPFGWGPTEAAVLPYRWRDGTALAYAAERGAALAVGRSEASPETPWTLSPDDLTPEARAAATLWEATRDTVAELHRCDSGRELYEYGYPQDVAVAAEVDTSETVPVLTDGAFLEAP
jgi:2-phosphosulfolactate phosphatase